MADFTIVHSTQHHQWNRLIVAAVIAVATVAVVLTVGTESAAVGEPPAPSLVHDSTVAVAPPTTTTPPMTPAARPVPITAETPEPIDATPVLVPDPRGGDLRVDPNADVLPVDYEAPPASTTVFDIEYGPEPAQHLDLHLPAEPDAPVVVFLHSGGWVGGDKRNIPELFRRFVDRGYAIASVNYRLAPTHTFPAPVDDVVLAIDWVRAIGAREGQVDGDRIVLAGVSAGGHLAALTAARISGSESGARPSPVSGSPVDAVVAIAGPADLSTFYGHDHPWATPLTEAFVGCSPCAEEELAEASPISHLHADLPPAYWAYGSEDVLVDVELQGIALAEAWAAASGPATSWLDVADGRGHVLEDAAVNQRFLEAFVDGAVER